MRMHMTSKKGIASVALLALAVVVIACFAIECDADTNNSRIIDAYYADGQVFYSAESSDSYVWAWVTSESGTTKPGAPERVINGKVDASVPAVLSEGKYTLYLRGATDSKRLDSKEIEIVKESFTIEPSSISIGVGGTAKITAKDAVYWTTDKDAISISYDSSGAIIIGKEQGSGSRMAEEQSGVRSVRSHCRQGCIYKADGYDNNIVSRRYTFG